MTAKVAIIGSGNIGTDLMIKVERTSKVMGCAAMVGIDPASDGLAMARRMGLAAFDSGLAGLMASDIWADVELVFDATSARSHMRHAEALAGSGRRIVDLTPAAIGPFVVPAVNGSSHDRALNVNMVTCGGQATIPIVAAIARAGPVPYAEIVASIASRSAGPGTRANIDEFTETTARAIESVGGATSGKAIIILNPAEPPLIMRDTVMALAEGSPDQITAEVHAAVAAVASYVPGYRLRQDVQIEPADRLPDGTLFGGLRVTVFLEVEGAAHYLPAYAGNLDIMTSAALRTAERMIQGAQGA